MAGDAAPTTGGRTFSEGETYALVESGVKRETAALTETVTKLETEKAAAETQIDAITVERDAAVVRAETAERELAEYKTQVENEKAAEATRGERESLVKAIAPKLLEGDDAPARSDRIVAMAAETFDDYLATLRESASAAGEPAPVVDPAAPTGGIPRVSAAFGGGDKNEGAPTGSLGGVLGARRALTS